MDVFVVFYAPNGDFVTRPKLFSWLGRVKPLPMDGPDTFFGFTAEGLTASGFMAFAGFLALAG